jgi:two-component system cell cycle sensor histidine kinase/response regulator CckA
VPTPEIPLHGSGIMVRNSVDINKKNKRTGYPSFPRDMRLDIKSWKICGQPVIYLLGVHDYSVGQMIMKKRINFTKLIQIWGIIFLIGTGVSILVIDIARSYRDFNFYADQMRADYTASQKQIIKHEVKRVVDRIHYEKAQIEMITKSKIKSRTYEAYSTAQNIHQQNQDIESKAKIQQMIRDALRPVRFENGSSYYFAVSMDGIEQLYPVQPELEGKNLISLQDYKGNFVIQDEINVIKKSGEGFVTDFWPKPGKDPAIAYEKISFVKYFKPLDWYFGTGLYVDDVENQIKADLLSTISRIRFGKEGYIFVNRLNGDALVSNGKLVSGEKKLWEVFNNNPEKTKKLFDKEYNAALKPEGDYIYYSLIKLSDPTKESPKASFVQGIPELQWLVGAGVYLDDVETDIARMQTELNNHTKMKMFYSALIATGIFIFYLILFSRLSRRLANDFNLFISFFNRAAHSDETINRDKVHFIEFDLMAKNANQMLRDKVLAQQNLMAEKERLQQSEERFKTLSNLTFEGVLIHNNGVVIDSNNAATKIIGYTREELIGKNIIQLCIRPEYHAIVQENIVKNSSKPYELMAKRKDGTVFPVEIEARNIKEGNKIFSVAALRDITERRQAEDILRENERYLDNIINAIADLIFVKNREHKWVLLNDAFCQFIGHKREELLGKSDHDFFPKEEADVFWTKDEVVFTSG